MDEDDDDDVDNVEIIFSLLVKRTKLLIGSEITPSFWTIFVLTRQT